MPLVGVRCEPPYVGASGDFSRSWLASLRFTSVEKHPGAPDRSAAASKTRFGVFVYEA